MVPRTRPVLVEAVGLQLAGDAEVGDLGPALGIDQDVLRLDIAVDKLAGMRGGEPAADLDRVGGGLVEGQPSQAIDPLLQRLALDVLEDDVGVAAVLAGVDHGDHVRVRELGHRAGLAAEALELVGLVGDLAVHDLHRDPALERLVASQVHRGHAAAAELGVEPVAA